MMGLGEGSTGILGIRLASWLRGVVAGKKRAATATQGLLNVYVPEWDGELNPISLN